MTRREGWSVLLLHSNDDDLIPADDVIAFEKNMRHWGWDIERQMWERWCDKLSLSPFVSIGKGLLTISFVSRSLFETTLNIASD